MGEVHRTRTTKLPGRVLEEAFTPIRYRLEWAVLLVSLPVTHADEKRGLSRPGL